MDAILVFDDAEALFGKRTQGDSSTDRHANMDTGNIHPLPHPKHNIHNTLTFSHTQRLIKGILLYHMERFPGIVVVTTNLIGNIDEAFFRRFRFVVEFTLPSVSLREKLWRVHLPAKAPLHKDVDFPELAQRFNFSGGVIKNSCFKAASAGTAPPLTPSLNIVLRNRSHCFPFSGLACRPRDKSDFYEGPC